MKKKNLLTALVSLVVLGLLALLFVLSVNLYVRIKAQKSFTTVEKLSQTGKKYDCILVLGAGLNKAGKPTDILRERLMRASELYKAGTAPKILVTGDNGRVEYNEVQAMENCLVEDYNIPRDAIVKDYAGFSTYDSMYRAREIFCVNSAVVVTQRFHLYRAVFVAQKMGLDAVGVSSNYFTYAKQIVWDTREYAARTKDFFSTIFKPKPKYLGEKLPINQ